MEILKTYCIDISSTTSKSRWPRNSSRMPMPKLTVSPFLGTKYSQISEISTFWRHIPIRKVAGFIYYILPNLNDRVSYQKNRVRERPLMTSHIFWSFLTYLNTYLVLFYNVPFWGLSWTPLPTLIWEGHNLIHL